MSDQNSQISKQILCREEYFLLVQAGIESGQYRFACEAVLHWLATYPGDLQAGLSYAQALIGEQHQQQALLILSGLLHADPEFVPAIETFIRAVQKAPVSNSSPGSYSSDQNQIRREHTDLPAIYFSLTGRTIDPKQVAPWGRTLREARQALQNGDLIKAEPLIHKALGTSMLHPLACVTHLKYLSMDTNASLETRLTAAKRYHQMLPDCLACTLWLAEWTIESGDTGTAIALLHQAAARDIDGQVIRRLWGDQHAYRPLWSDRLGLELRHQVPAEVASLLGWNLLKSGQLIQSSTESAKIPNRVATVLVSEKLIESLPKKSEERDEIREVAEAFDNIAHHLEMDGLKDLDTRFPVYVVMSCRSRLQTVYNIKIAEQIEAEMIQLCQAVKKSSGWGSLLFLVDVPESTSPFNIIPVKRSDPWKIKQALGDLDDALGKRGERIGALLIVGGPEIIPFHQLPNPVDDQDLEVPSDNPYANRDENYFIPEWPVGRLPTSSKDKGQLLMIVIKRACRVHGRRRREAWSETLWNSLSTKVNDWLHGGNRSFGYTAAVWKEAAAQVYKPLGRKSQLQVSPPRGAPEEGVLKPKSRQGGVPKISGGLGYFNLHGLVDAIEWYGHRDSQSPAEGPDYPVALRPSDIDNRSGKAVFPKIIFSEACYGLHVQGRKVNEAISLKFLEAGCQAVVGSTCMSYGSIEGPLSAADLLGYIFFRCLQGGMTAGEALRQSKLYLANEMQRRQGHLDGEDQKTLISFILYGDPLAVSVWKGRIPKSIRYRVTPLVELKTVCDRAPQASTLFPLPADVLSSIRQVVSHYLPRMTDAQVRLAEEREHCDAGDHSCPTNQLEEKPLASTTQVDLSGPSGKRGKSSYQNSTFVFVDKSTHRLVTLSKQIQSPSGIHPEVARLTLDERGKLVKLVVSR